MPDIINLTCPSCGGKFQITNDIERFACGHCGNELIIQRRGGAITVSPIVEGLIGVKAGVDRTAAELAIVRLKEDISTLAEQRKKCYKADTNGSLVFLAAFILTSACGVTYALFGDLSIAGRIASLLFILFLTAVFVLIFNNVRRKEAIIWKDYTQRIQSIDDVITKKTQELAKYQAIVGGK